MYIPLMFPFLPVIFERHSITLVVKGCDNTSGYLARQELKHVLNMQGCIHMHQILLLSLDLSIY